MNPDGDEQPVPQVEDQQEEEDGPHQGAQEEISEPTQGALEEIPERQREAQEEIPEPVEGAQEDIPESGDKVQGPQKDPKDPEVARSQQGYQASQHQGSDGNTTTIDLSHVRKYKNSKRPEWIDSHTWAYSYSSKQRKQIWEEELARQQAQGSGGASSSSTKPGVAAVARVGEAPVEPKVFQDAKEYWEWICKIADVELERYQVADAVALSAKDAQEETPEQQHEDETILLIEACSGPKSKIGQQAEILRNQGKKVIVLRITEEDDITTEACVEGVLLKLASHVGPVHLWGSLPCTGGAGWQSINWFKGPATRTKLRGHVRMFQKIFAGFVQIALAVDQRQGTVTYEWPQNNKLWKKVASEADDCSVSASRVHCSRMQCRARWGKG